MNDYYKILEVKPQASKEEIKKSYQKLIKQYHPDRNSSNEGLVKFQQIQKAYEILSNPETKQDYDLYGNIHAYHSRHPQNTQEENEHKTKRKMKLTVSKLEILLTVLLIGLYMVTFGNKRSNPATLVEVPTDQTAIEHEMIPMDKSTAEQEMIEDIETN